jgi:hypothetical protein
MAEPPNRRPLLTVVILLVVALVTGFVFMQLSSQSSRPEASGAGGVGVDAATNSANHP